MQAQGKVLVTGATGYLASHIIQQLLQKGYHVVGTVRSLTNKQKYQFLTEFQGAKQRLTFRQADLLNAESWVTALQGIQGVFHVASPIPPGIPKDENQLIKPAVEGTLNVINGALKNHVKRIVFTSSCLTLVIRSDGKIPNEEDWSEIGLLHHYPKSKFLAEKTFWEEAGKHSNELQFVSVLPSLVTGPAFVKHGNSMMFLMVVGYPGIPNPPADFSTVDVRDVAATQIKAYEYPEAKGRRWIASGERISHTELFALLRERYEPKGYKVPTNLIDAEGIKAANHGPSLRILPLLGKVIKVDNTRSNTQLGLTFRPVRQSLSDQAERQIQIGIVHKP